MQIKTSFSIDELLNDRYGVYAKHRPFSICEDTSDIWIFDHSLCKEALLSKHFSSKRSRLQDIARKANFSILADFYDNWLMYSEGEKHKTLKKIASMTVNSTLAESNTRYSNNFDISQKEFDLISDFCEPLVLRELSSRLGMSKEEFEYWMPRLKSLIALPGSKSLENDDFIKAKKDLKELREFINNGEPKNLFYTLLKQQGTLYSNQELVDLTINVLGDGVHPTVAGLGICIFHLIKSSILTTDREHDNVEDLMAAPFQYVARQATRNILLGNLQINKGDRVVLCIGASCPNFNNNMNILNKSENLTFGRGIHSCLGKKLALTVIETGIKRFREITRMRVSSNIKPCWINSVGYLSIESCTIVRDDI